MKRNYFDEDVAERYDDPDDEMEQAAAIDPVVDFLADLAGDGAALELGIGTGRIALPLAGAASPCTGSTCRRRWSRSCRPSRAPRRSASRSATSRPPRWTAASRLAYLVYNTIMNLTTQDEQVACFRNAAAHLEPGGCFVIEVMRPDLQRLPAGETIRPFTVTPDAPRLRRVRRRRPRVSRRTTTPSPTGRSGTFSMPFRYVWPSELDLMARLAGMTLRERLGGWHREPFNADSTKHVSVWERDRVRPGACSSATSGTAPDRRRSSGSRSARSCRIPLPACTPERRRRRRRPRGR